MSSWVKDPSGDQFGVPIGTFSGRLGTKGQRGCQKVFLTLKQSFFMKIGVLLVILCQNNQPKPANQPMGHVSISVPQRTGEILACVFLGF